MVTFNRCLRCKRSSFIWNKPATKRTCTAEAIGVLSPTGTARGVGLRSDGSTDLYVLSNTKDFKYVGRLSEQLSENVNTCILGFQVLRSAVGKMFLRQLLR